MTKEETIIIPATSRSSDSNSDDIFSYSDTVFGFLDENYPSSGNSSQDMFDSNEDDDSDNDDNYINSEDKKAFWDEQEKLLNGILCRTSSIESRVRNATKEGLKKVIGGSHGNVDSLRQQVFHHLCNNGFLCSLQNSKWRSSHDIPSGEHRYLEVKEKSSSSEVIKVIIELNFRAEFEMGKSSEEYNNLIKKLPQVYVGKKERLKNIVKLLCGAANICMNDKKMHLAPWRKHKYMQAKWLSSSLSPSLPLETKTTKYSDDRRLVIIKPRASLLTRSLIEGLSRTHCQTVEVI